ncbi:hypothetical protein [Escherichia coli]|uniref:hypothetical protein n=1 Tax=Escherichia coli TaxID=562 RepID=UPI0015C9174B|nr:hypothetical protein [Escherichia coli]NYP34825.1 hypothetical protein [Escherichia coli]
MMALFIANVLSAFLFGAVTVFTDKKDTTFGIMGTLVCLLFAANAFVLWGVI